MRYTSFQSLNLGLLGSTSSIVALACAMGSLACSAEDPQPIMTGTGATQPGIVQPQAMSTSTADTTMPVGTTPVQPGPAGQPSATVPMPGGTDATTTPPPTGTTPGGGLPMPGAGDPGAGAPTTSAAPTAATPPADTAPESMTPEPEPSTGSGTASGEGNLLQANADFWIGGNTNGVGVEGAWYPYDDGETEVELAMVGDAVCLTGTMAAGEDPATQWGAGMGLILNDAGSNKQDEWDGSSYAGFSFTADITSETAVTLEMVTSDADPPHEATLKNGSNTVRWSDVAQPSWASDTTSFDESTLLKLQFKVARSTATNDFELCISNLTVE